MPHSVDTYTTGL